MLRVRKRFRNFRTNYLIMSEQNKQNPQEEAPQEQPEKKPFFVHTFTDDGVTSDYADAKEAYGYDD